MTKQSLRNNKKVPDLKLQEQSGSFLSAIDLITLVFCGWILAYMSIGIGRTHDAWIHIPRYLSIAIGVLLLAWANKQALVLGRPRLHKALSFIRGIYPVFLFGYFFTSGHAFNRIIVSDWLDPWFMQIDKSVFGYYPSLEWGKTYSNWAIQELFHFAYFCYYPMIVGLPVYLYFKQPKAFKELIFNLTFVFYLCYTIYSVLPTIGGRYIPEAMEITKTYRGGLFTHIMVFIYRTSGHLGGAFPSSHIAITLVLTVAALRFVKPMGIVFPVIAFFLTIATVYCHYHWAIDAAAGIVTGIGAYYLANYTRAKLSFAGFH
jgi:membrane-associated phospholipid phosphatase